MSKLIRLFVGVTAVAALLNAAACGSGDDVTVFPDAPLPPDAEPLPDVPPGAPDAEPPATPVDVTAEITADTTWSADHFYILKTHIFVRGGTLTIEPGVKIFADQGSSLVITSGAQIDAQGTALAPIVFSSSQDEGSRLPGDWGGVVLLGLAPINVLGGTSQIEGFPAGTMGTQYGGTDATHDCGTMRYVRIEFAGFELAPANELNGLTVGACGSDTELDFIHAHLGSDDGVEFFGGTVDIKHLLITQSMDDGLDWDFGWIGRVQFLIIQQSVHSNQGIEADNNPTNNDALPRSMPTIYNATIVGSDRSVGGANQTQKGMHLRRGTAGHLFNVILAHFTDFPIDVDGASTVAQTPVDLFVKNSIFFDNGNQTLWADATDNDGMFDEGAYFKTDPTNRTSDPKVQGALNQTAPNFHPGTASPAFTASAAAVPPSDGFFDVSATFCGAIGDGLDWTDVWTAYPAN
jgi:hypothetical protein